MDKSTRKKLKNGVHWILVVYLVFYVLTGLGIIYWRQIEPLTLGVLDKPLSNQIHDNLHYPFAVLLAVHIFVSLVWKRRDGNG